MPKHKDMTENDDWMLREMLRVAMEDQRSSAARYRVLAAMAKKGNDRRSLYDMADDETRHRHLLAHLYHLLWGRSAPKSKAPHLDPFGHFDEEIGRAIVDEYEGIAFERDLIARLNCEEHKTLIRTIMGAKQRHALLLEEMLTGKL